MTIDDSMINKNTSKMTNSNGNTMGCPVRSDGELTTTIFSTESNENSFLLMDTETHFDHDGTVYLSAHHHVIAELASIMGDNDMAYVIRDVGTMRSLITLEDRIINANDTRFEDVKMDLLFSANYYKFLHNTTARDKLLATGTTTIMHVNKILSPDELADGMEYLNRDMIDGNCLGRILTEVRSTIRDRMPSTRLL